ncbi:hypothetical protein QA596_12600 [Balneolales bacterium ANBcel1]|nr:hypothetical protein [Balneolales bacterium ANBcel1]
MLDSSQPSEPLAFEKMEVQYTRFGGWIHKSELFVHSSGIASAKVTGHASGEVIRDTSITLTEDQQKMLSNSFAFFSRYERHYQPDKFMTDGDFHQIILTYDGVADTVLTYMPYESKLPKNLLRLIEDLDQLHQIILQSNN